MNKEQALKNLSLPADTDIETIRLRFAARYTLSDSQYDRTLTEGMKEVHEQHLRELEQAYKVLTDSPVIADMGALLSMGKGYIEEGQESIGGDEAIGTEEALAFFALYPHDSPLLAEQRYNRYVGELEDELQQVGLEASKEPLRQEIARAEQHLTVAINYLLANQLIASQEKVREATVETEVDGSQQEENTIATPIRQSVAKPRSGLYKYLLIGIAVLALFGSWWAKGRWGSNDAPSNEDKAGVIAVAAEQQGKEQPVREKATPTPEVAQTEPTKEVPTLTNRSPKRTIEEILHEYVPGQDIEVTEDAIRTNNHAYFLLFRNIDTINALGQFLSLSDRPFVVHGKETKTSGDFKLSNASPAIRKQLMEAIRAIVPLPTGKTPISKQVPDSSATKPVVEQDSKTINKPAADLTSKDSLQLALPDKVDAAKVIL